MICLTDGSCSTADLGRKIPCTRTAVIYCVASSRTKPSIASGSRRSRATTRMCSSVFITRLSSSAYLGAPADGPQPFPADQRAARINHPPVPAEGPSCCDIGRVDAGLRPQDHGVGGLLQEEIRRHLHISRPAKQLVVCRRGDHRPPSTSYLPRLSHCAENQL